MTEDDWQEIDFIQDEVREELDNILENSSDGTSAWSIGDIWRKIFTKYMDELDRGGHS